MKTIITLLFLVSINFSFAQLSFKESATAKGVGVSYGASNLGGGVSFYDFNGDGWDDITFASGLGDKVYFFKNNNGMFSLFDFGIKDLLETKQVIWIDYDNDGDKDFFATSITGNNKFYRNDGNMTFTDISSTIGLFTDNLYTFGASFGDIDNDGDLDVFICNRDVSVNRNQHNYLFRNDNGTYIDISVSSGITLGNQLSFTASFFDYNNDGFQDIYVANDKPGNINRLYKNNGNGTFDDVSVESGTDLAIDGMSTTIDDYNYDGWFDIYVSNTVLGNYHLRNNGDGTFTNVAADLGTGFYSVAWGSVFLDADNDGDLDLYVSGMPIDNDPLGRLPSAFYENQGDNTYLIPSNIGFESDTSISFSNAIGDFNNDGFPDIIVMNDTYNNFLWENTTSNSNNWLKVNLEGTTSNRDGIGSIIEIFSNGKKQYRYTLSGEGYMSQNSGTEFFGLGSATNIDYVKVTWLSGIIDILTNVTPNQTLSIVESQTLGVSDFNLETVHLFPNPVNDKLKISNTQSNFNKVVLYSVLGKFIYSKNFTDNNIELDVSRLPSGIYLLKLLMDDNKVVIKKVVIE